MAIRETRVIVALLASTLACTVFNGKSFDDSGTVVDAGPSPGDGAVEAGTTPLASCGCDKAGLVLCDSFETGLARWSVSSKGAANAPSIDGARAHCGTSSVHMHLPAIAAATNVGAILSEGRALADPSLAGGFYARVWLSMTSASRIAPGNTMTFLQAQQNTNQFYGIAAQVGSTTVNLSDFTGPVAAGGASKMPLPRDVWTCAKWHVAYDTSNGTSELVIDNAADGTAQMKAVDTKPSPGYAYFILQAYFESEPADQSAIDVWFDDLAIDDKPLDCEP